MPKVAEELMLSVTIGLISVIAKPPTFLTQLAILKPGPFKISDKKRDFTGAKVIKQLSITKITTNFSAGDKGFELLIPKKMKWKIATDNYPTNKIRFLPYF